MNFKKTKYLITLNNFICQDLEADDKTDICKTIYFHVKEGFYYTVKATFVGVQGNYTQIYKDLEINETVQRPFFKMSESEYYLDLAEQARSEDQNSVILKRLIELYEMSKRHEKMNADLEKEFENFKI